LRQKVRRGEFPGLAPTGYLNNPRTKTIVIDRKKAPIMKKFELYTQGNSRLKEKVNPGRLSEKKARWKSLWLDFFVAESVA